MSKIKRAVSLYSLQDKYARGIMTLDQILSSIEKMDVEGFEFISDQMMHGTPHPTAQSLQDWDALMGKHPIKPVCNDIFINTALYKNRTLTTWESTQLLISEIELANRLGFHMVRLVSKTPAEIIEPALTTAEKLDVTLALEIHAGMSFTNSMTMQFISEMKRLQSSHLGLVVDTGIFCRRHPRVATKYFKDLGLNNDVADYIDEIFVRGSDPLREFEKMGHGQFPADLEKLFKSDIDRMYGIFSSGYENSELSILDQYMPYIKHFHGKFYEMTDAGEEYSIPYGEIIAYLQQKKYDGYIASEYEGQRFVLFDQEIPDLDQVGKHQEMLKKLIAGGGRSV